GPAEAALIMKRLVEDYGGQLASPPAGWPALLFPTPNSLAQARLSSYGLSRQTVQRCQQLARAVAERRVCFSPISTFDDLVLRLEQTAAFDRPTAHWIAMRTLGEPDAVPFGARAIRGLEAWTQPAFADHERWRPWRSYVAVLWVTAHLRASALGFHACAPEPPGWRRPAFLLGAPLPVPR